MNIKNLIKKSPRLNLIGRQVKSSYKAILRRLGFYTAPKMLEGELEFFSAIYKYCNVIVDVGARFDVDYIDISKGNKIAYYLFEANPFFYKRLMVNIKNYNECVHAENLAVGDFDGLVDYYEDAESVLQSTTAVPNSKQKISTKLSMIKLYSYFLSHGVDRIDFLKTDIEEYDYFALIGAHGLLNSCKFIQFELGIGAPLKDASGGSVTNEHYFNLFEGQFNLYVLKDENNPLWKSGMTDASLIVLDHKCRMHIEVAQRSGVGFNIVCINKLFDIALIRQLKVASL